MSDALLTIRGLCVTLGAAEILRGIDLDLPRGSVTALIGLNGAGKTTLLKAIIRELPCTGEVRFHCGHPADIAPSKHVGYVPQRLRLDGNLPMSVLDLFGLSLRGWPILFGLGGAFRKKVSALLSMTGAEKLIDRPADKLSGGELQRVLLALAMEPRPELLLLDEPAAGIDFRMQEAFYDLIGGLNRTTGVTVLLVSHDLSMVHRVATQVLCLKDGRIDCRGTPEEMLRGDVLGRTFGAEAGVFVHRGHS